MCNEFIEFRVLTKYTESAARYVARILRMEGIKIYDGRKTEIVKDSDGSIVDDVGIICCRGTVEQYDRFRNKHRYDEIMYEGFKTLT